MRWCVRGLAWILVGALVLLAPALPRVLPSNPEGLAAQAYAGWSGVLRAWVPSSYSVGGGSLMPWLNRCFTRFERTHPGVYVQLIPVPESMIAAFGQSDANPPDLLLFAPGMLNGTDDLLPLAPNAALLPSLQNTGDQRGTTYAQPIAMGGYAWAINTQLLSGAPLGDIALSQPKKGDPIYVMQAPADGAFTSWSGALLSLCLRLPDQDQPGATQPPVGEGIDLGLSSTESPHEQPAEPTPEPARLALSFPDVLPPDFRKASSVMTSFTAGRAAAIPVTNAQIQRLAQLSDQGRGAEYQIIPGLRAFTDQLMMCAVVTRPRDDAQARQALGAELVNLLLDDTSQSALDISRALRVTRGAPLYTGQSPMAALECGYAGEISCPNAFDPGFRARAAQQLDAKLLTP